MNGRVAVIVSFCVFLWATAVTWGQTARIGPEFQVNTTVTSYQERGKVASNGSGDFVVVWQSFGQDGSGWGVFGQRYDGSGLKEGGEFQVNTYTTGDQYLPAVSMDDAGAFAVVWQSVLQDGSFHGIYGQRFSSSGAKSGNEFRINTYTTNDQTDPSVDHDGTGNFVVNWGSDAEYPAVGQDGSFSGIYGQRYSSSGATAGSQFRANTYTRESQSYPVVRKSGSGTFVVVWQSYGQDGSDYSVWGQRYTAGGKKSGGDFRVNTYTNYFQGLPTISVNPSGAFVVAWESYGQFGAGGYDVVAQRYNSAGSKIGSEFRVNTYTNDDQQTPAVAIDSSGNFVIVWRSRLQDGWASGVFGQRYDSSGVPRGSEFRVNTYTVGEQRAPSVDMDSVGNFVVVWSSAGQDGQSTGTFGQRFSLVNCPLPGVSGPFNQTSCPGSTAFFTVTTTGLGPFTYQWRKGGVNVVDGPTIRGASTSTLRIAPVSASHAGTYDCIVTDYCLPPVSVTSASATLTVSGGTPPGVVSGLRLQKVNAGANLKLTWNNATNATSYTVYEDTTPDGIFATQAGTATSGPTGLTIPMPAGNRYYLVAGRNATCGPGPLQ